MPKGFMTLQGRVRLGDLDLDVDQRRVTHRGGDLKLSKLTFRALLALASAAPALVSQDELAELVWAGRIVSPETVAQRIKLLRQALRDDARQPRYVEVVHGQGYRWKSTVEPVHAAKVTTQFVGNLQASEGISLTLPSQPSIVVLPFDTMGDERLEHRLFADGLTHDIITSIGRARWLFVIARGSAFMFRGGAHNVTEVARKLGVRYVVQGNVSLSGRKVSANAALADAVSGNEVWAEHFGGSVDDFFTIQQEIANLVVSSVETEIEHEEQKRSLLTPPASLDAWSAYHRAWWHLNSFSEGCFDRAEHFFKHSLELDPHSPRSYAGLSTVHWIRAFLELNDDRNGEIQRALEFAQHGVGQDPRDPLAHWALGRALHLAHDFGRSVQEFELSNTLNPSFALGRFAQAFAMMHTGESERSNQLLDSARRLSPYDTMSYAMLGIQSINKAMLGHYDEAADLSVRGAALQTIYCQMFPVIAAYCNVLAGRDDVAGKYYSRLRESRPGYDSSDYFRAFPHQRDADIEKITRAFERLNRLH